MKNLYVFFLILIILTICFIIFDYLNTSFSFFDFIDQIGKLVTFGLLIANCLVAALIGYQLHQSKNHFLDLNRPWIHLDLGHVNTTTYAFNKAESDVKYPLFLVNRGNLTAHDVEIMFLKSESNVMEDYLEYIPENIQFKQIPPNFKYRMFDEVYYLISNSNYLVFSVSYKFNGKTYKSKAFITKIDNQVPTCTDKMPIGIKK